MAKIKLSAAQARLLEIYESAKKTAHLYEQYEPFDFPCPNNYCTSYMLGEGREIAQASKNKDGKTYNVFCYSCGEDHKLTSKEMKKLRSESTMPSMKTSKIIKLHQRDEDEEDECEYYLRHA